MTCWLVKMKRAVGACVYLFEKAIVLALPCEDGKLLSELDVKG